jgi:hypothetical protein
MIVLSIGGAIYVSALALVSIVAGFAGTLGFSITSNSAAATRREVASHSARNVSE